MAKTKLKDRIKEKISKLFNRNSNESEKLINLDKSSIEQTESEFRDGEESSKIFTFLRQALLFAPGAFVVWGMSAEFTYRFFMNAGENPTITYIILLAGFFAILLGIGDIRRAKDYLMPISVMGVGSLGAFLAWATGSNLLMMNQYGLLFFPLALVVPFIVKFWIYKDKY